MNRTVWMNQLSWVDYQARITKDHPPVLLPVGAKVDLSVQGRDALVFWGHLGAHSH